LDRRRRRRHPADFGQGGGEIAPAQRVVRPAGGGGVIGRKRFAEIAGRRGRLR